MFSTLGFLMDFIEKRREARTGPERLRARISAQALYFDAYRRITSFLQPMLDCFEDFQ